MTLSICRFGDPTPLGAQKGGVTKTARFAVLTLLSDLVVTTACAIRRLSCLFDCGLFVRSNLSPPPLAPCWQAMDESVAGVLTVGGTKRPCSERGPAQQAATSPTECRLARGDQGVGPGCPKSGERHL